MGFLPLSDLNVEPSLTDQFWKEKLKRTVGEMTSVSELREVACMLADLATARQGVIRALVRDVFELHNVVIIQDDDSSPGLLPDADDRDK